MAILQFLTIILIVSNGNLEPLNNRVVTPSDHDPLSLKAPLAQPKSSLILTNQSWEQPQCSQDLVPRGQLIKQNEMSSNEKLYYSFVANMKSDQNILFNSEAFSKCVPSANKQLCTVEQDSLTDLEQFFSFALQYENEEQLIEFLQYSELNDNWKETTLERPEPIELNQAQFDRLFDQNFVRTMLIFSKLKPETVISVLQRIMMHHASRHRLPEPLFGVKDNPTEVMIGYLKFIKMVYEHLDDDTKVELSQIPVPNYMLVVWPLLGGGSTHHSEHIKPATFIVKSPEYEAASPKSERNRFVWKILKWSLIGSLTSVMLIGGSIGIKMYFTKPNNFPESSSIAPEYTPTTTTDQKTSFQLYWTFGLLVITCYLVAQLMFCFWYLRLKKRRIELSEKLKQTILRRRKKREMKRQKKKESKISKLKLEMCKSGIKLEYKSSEKEEEKGQQIKSKHNQSAVQSPQSLNQSNQSKISQSIIQCS